MRLAAIPVHNRRDREHQRTPDSHAEPITHAIAAERFVADAARNTVRILAATAPNAAADIRLNLRRRLLKTLASSSEPSMARRGLRGLWSDPWGLINDTACDLQAALSMQAAMKQIVLIPIGAPINTKTNDAPAPS